MPLEKVGARMANTNLDTGSTREILALLNAIVDAQRALAVKLDAEATLTAKNFTATVDAAVRKT